MYQTIKTLALGSALFVATATTSFASEVFFTEIPLDVYGTSLAVSENGVVALQSGSTAYKWTSTNGLVSLGYVGDVNLTMFKTDISNNGEVVLFPAERSVFKGLEQQDVSGLIPYSISADGSALVGRESDASYPAMMSLTDKTITRNPNSDLQGLISSDISTDGNVKLIVETSGYGLRLGRYLAYADGSTQSIDGQLSHAMSLSGDGLSVIGSNYCENGPYFLSICAGLWTSDNQYIELGEFSAGAVNYDGSIVIGNGNQHGAVVWDSINGVRALSDVLTAKGIDISGWSGLILHDISGDGTYLVGSGTSPSGVVHGFLVSVLPQCSVGL